MSPEFNGGTLEYTATTDSATESVTATATDPEDTVTIKVNGTKKASGANVTLKEGENTITVTVKDSMTPSSVTTYTVVETYTPANP